MARYKFKNIDARHKRLASGEYRIYLYHRKTRNRLPDDVNSHEFLLAYTAEENVSHKSVNRNKGTLKELIQIYVQSPEFERLSVRSKQDYRGHIIHIENKFGDMRQAVLEDMGVRKHFLAWRDELGRRSTRQADYAVSVLRRILSCSKRRGLLLHNHAEKLGKLDECDRSQKIWTKENVESFLDVAHIEIAFSLILALDTGQRQGDLLTLRWNALNKGELTVDTSKTDVTVLVPVTNRLQNWLDKINAYRKSRGVSSTTILAGANGLPWKEHAFRRHFGAARDKAGIKGLTFHDLRGTFVTNLADADCTPHHIAAITGHSLRSVHDILEKYSARTKKQSRAAIRKLEQSRLAESANQCANRESSND